MLSDFTLSEHNNSLTFKDILSSNDKVALADAVLPWYWCLGFSCKVDEYCWSTLAHCAR